MQDASVEHFSGSARPSCFWPKRNSTDLTWSLLSSRTSRTHYKHTDFLEMRHSLSLRTVMLTSHFDLGVKWWEDVLTAPDFRRPCWAGMDEPHLPATLWTSACPKPTACRGQAGGCLGYDSNPGHGSQCTANGTWLQDSVLLRPSTTHVCSQAQCVTSSWMTGSGKREGEMGRR
ncbi:hypothetical protein L1887_62427 [Cichorium endivia]|nr:hypothetical protein L1887_62427 [Cichorium endivia]